MADTTENKIQLKFELYNLEKIGFSAKIDQQEFWDWLHSLQETGIDLNTGFYDDLCKNTISNGHNLLRSKDIFNIDSTVIGPMAKIIGQYLFRLLFGANNFRGYLHDAKKQKKELEIILEFDQAKEDSKKIMNLPWELMYCPDQLAASDEDEDEDGFFVSQAAAIYRKYKNTDDLKPEDMRAVCVSVAFLTKDIENLKEVYDGFKVIAGQVEQENANIRFEFINTPNEVNKSINLLSKEDLGKIFLYNKNEEAAAPVNKIVHLVCDVSITQSTRNPENPAYEKALYFNKTRNETEPISLTDVFKELFNKNILQDPSLKLLVLQAWNDEKNNAYSGFEEIASRVIRKSQAAIISMPYLLNQKSADGRAAFFETLYRNLAGALSLVEAVQNLRNDIVPKFAYGFPLLYLNGRHDILVSKGAIAGNAAPAPASKSIADQRMADLDAQERLLLEKKSAFEKRNITTNDEGTKFELKHDLIDIDQQLNTINEERKKYTGDK